MRLRIVIALSLLFIPSLSWGGAASKLRGVMNTAPRVITSNAIGGIAAIATAGPTDTGTGYGTGNGTIDITAECDATGTSGTSGVYLYVNGSLAGSVVCNHGDYIAPTVLTASVSGSYTARVYGIATGDSDYTATPFNFPVTP